MFLMVPAHPGCHGQNPGSHKTVVCVHACAFCNGLGREFLGSGSQTPFNGSPRNFHRSLVWGQPLKATFENFSPTPKKLAGKTLLTAINR